MKENITPFYKIQTYSRTISRILGFYTIYITFKRKMCVFNQQRIVKKKKKLL